MLSILPINVLSLYGLHLINYIQTLIFMMILCAFFCLYVGWGSFYFSSFCGFSSWITSTILAPVLIYGFSSITIISLQQLYHKVRNKSVFSQQRAIGRLLVEHRLGPLNCMHYLVWLESGIYTCMSCVSIVVPPCIYWSS